MKKGMGVFLFVCLVFLIIFYTAFHYLRLIPMEIYYDDDFGYSRIRSELDADGDSIDDYQDILEGAREYVNTYPKYKSAYYQGGYPPEGEGVCTDVIWYAFQHAGYDFKKMVDEDIKNHLEEYTTIVKPDPNIDFRRVRNLKIFFDRNAISLTTNLKLKEEWQGGDIVVFDGHIAIVSDRRNSRGIPYIVHQSRRLKKEEDAITLYKIVGHYRFHPSTEKRDK